MTTTLRYTGAHPTAFADQRIGWQEPGNVFGVPNAEAEAYTRRGDVVVVSMDPEDTDTPKAPQTASEAVSVDGIDELTPDPAPDAEPAI